MFVGGAGQRPAPSVRVLSLSGGDAGVFETLEHMKRLVIESETHPEVKEAAAMIVRGCTPTDFMCYAKSVFDYAKAHFQYVPDTHGVEEITAPWVHSQRVLSTGSTYGDCDDYSVTLASWLRSIGVPTRLTVVASKLHGGAYDHVRAEARVLGRWVPLEATMRRSKFGERMRALREKSLEV